MEMSFIIAILLLCAGEYVYSQSGVYKETQAVAIQFPDPDHVIDSPAFRKSAPEFTTYEEMSSFIESLKSISTNLEAEKVGVSQAGRDIVLLKFQTGSQNDTVTVKKPTVLIIGHQHGNELAGGEATLAIASEIAKDPSLLDKMTLLIVPRANPDGASKNRRGLDNGDDVNRDHLLLQSPEGQALARVFSEHNPEIVMDCHEFSVADRWLTKFNALQRADGMLQYATVANLAPSLQSTTNNIRDLILAAFNANGLSNDWYFTTNRVLSDKTVSMGGVSPDTGRNIAGLRNAVSFLLETRGFGIGLAHFKRRVFTHLVAIRAILDYVAKNPEAILESRIVADEAVIAAAGKGTITVIGSQTLEEREISLLDPEDGLLKAIKVPWGSALKIQSDLSRNRPFGYVLKATETKSIETLQKLGVKISRICGSVQLEKYTVTDVQEVNKTDVTGSVGSLKSTILKIATELKAENRTVEIGDYYVPLDQALGNIVVTALEPESQSSFPANYFLSPNITVGLTLPVYRVLQKPASQFVLSDTNAVCSTSVLGSGSGSIFMTSILSLIHS